MSFADVVDRLVDRNISLENEIIADVNNFNDINVRFANNKFATQGLFGLIHFYVHVSTITAI